MKLHHSICSPAWRHRCSLRVLKRCGKIKYYISLQFLISFPLFQKTWIDLASFSKVGKYWVQKKRVCLWESNDKKVFRKMLTSKSRFQGLQILLMSGVSVTSASQILESFWNIWSQVSDFPARGPDMYTPLWGICEVAVAARWPGKLMQIHDSGHRVNFDGNLPSSCFVIQYNSLISMI